MTDLSVSRPVVTLWHAKFTGTPEHQITDDQAMASYCEFQAIAERLEREI